LLGGEPVDRLIHVLKNLNLIPPVKGYCFDKSIEHAMLPVNNCGSILRDEYHALKLIGNSKNISESQIGHRIPEIKKESAHGLFLGQLNCIGAKLNTSTCAKLASDCYPDELAPVIDDHALRIFHSGCIIPSLCRLKTTKYAKNDPKLEAKRHRGRKLLRGMTVDCFGPSAGRFA
jgi:hypothetical protein